MACVTDVYDCAAMRGGGNRLSFGSRKLVHVAVLLAVGLVAGSWMMTALDVLETVIPAFVPVASALRRIPLTAPQRLAVVDQNKLPSRLERRSFIAAYTADVAYSNLDWRSNKIARNAQIIAEIGPDSVIEDKPVDAIPLIEPRAERVRWEPELVANAPQAVPDQVPDMTAGDGDRSRLFLPDDVPLPASKPALRRSRMRGQKQLAYAPENGETDAPQPELFSPLLNRAAHNRVAVYDISAATVYLPSGEALEAHSGLGRMRDNPRYVNQKNRGPTPPHSYDMRMREARFHGVEAIRLTPSDGENQYNRDGLLAHTFMLGRRGDSNGCVVFKDYARFLRAFKRGEVNKLVVVARLPASTPARVASLF
ncbi:DUF2778 domain-containing protein [Ochrobactrum sp. CM-21-5]|nr:DUF2778 domain-containing protein [Ochrobactrum sp. CM-21-5]MBC2886257.1 DUF2778 domain-containing protein [Ochrobactrum sp. CM-21-5]